jgi:virginiamycin A acetyltransferase
MSTVPDPMSVHWPEMIDDQEKNTVFLKPLVTSPKIEVGEFTYYNDTDDPTLFETRNVLYTAGPEKLIIGKFCAIATGAKFLLSSANHPMLGSTAFPFFIFGGTWLEKTVEFLPRIHSRGGNPAKHVRERFSDEDIDRLLRIAWWDWPVDVITEHVRTIWAGTPVELEQAAKEAGLLD